MMQYLCVLSIAAIALSNCVCYGAAGEHVLFTDQQLNPTQGLVSKNGRFKLVMEESGNLVLKMIINKGREVTIWQSNSHTVGGSIVYMQPDGNLVVLAIQGTKPIWASGSSSKDKCTLILQDDGNLCINQPEGDGAKAIWASNTCGAWEKYDQKVRVTPQCHAESKEAPIKLAVKLDPETGVEIQVKGNSADLIAIYKNGALIAYHPIRDGKDLGRGDIQAKRIPDTDDYVIAVRCGRKRDLFFAYMVTGSDVWLSGMNRDSKN